MCWLAHPILSLISTSINSSQSPSFSSVMQPQFQTVHQLTGATVWRHSSVDDTALECIRNSLHRVPLRRKNALHFWRRFGRLVRPLIVLLVSVERWARPLQSLLSVSHVPCIVPWTSSVAGQIPISCCICKCHPPAIGGIPELSSG